MSAGSPPSKGSATKANPAKAGDAKPRGYGTPFTCHASRVAELFDGGGMRSPPAQQPGSMPCRSHGSQRSGAPKREKASYDVQAQVVAPVGLAEECGGARRGVRRGGVRSPTAARHAESRGVGGRDAGDGERARGADGAAGGDAQGFDGAGADRAGRDVGEQCAFSGHGGRRGGGGGGGGGPGHPREPRRGQGGGGGDGGGRPPT